MQTATGLLKINDGTQYPVHGVTPAEALLLNAMFKAKNGGVTELVYASDIKTEPLGEVNRLNAKYAKGVARRMFPGGTPSLPVTFAEAKLDCKGCPAKKE